jgi:hypothetical protein
MFLMQEMLTFCNITKTVIFGAISIQDIAYKCFINAFIISLSLTLRLVSLLTHDGQNGFV